MLRWNEVSDQQIFDMTVKMYREPFWPGKTFVSTLKNKELDHYAYKHMDSEIYMYRILDTNFENYIEERGDMNRILKIKIPVELDQSRSIL